MKIVTNEKLIKRNKMIGNITSIAGIVILAAGLILNINPTPQKTLISFGALIVGFIISQVSTYFVTRFGRNPRFDQVIEENLEKLNNHYTFYVYTSPVPMLLVGPAGLWIPIPVSASGEIYYDKRWKQRGGSFLLKLFGQENIGRPEMDVQANEKEITKFLSENLGEENVPEINSILVSLHPNGTIGDIENAPTPIVEVDALRRSIRKVDRKKEEALSDETLEKINGLFGGD
jgi:hypothetical protein